MGKWGAAETSPLRSVCKNMSSVASCPTGSVLKCVSLIYHEI